MQVKLELLRSISILSLKKKISLEKFLKKFQSSLSNQEIAEMKRLLLISSN